MSKRMQKAAEEDRRTILRMWSGFAKTRLIAQTVGLSDAYVLQVIRAAINSGECEERRIWHDPGLDRNRL